MNKTKRKEFTKLIKTGIVYSNAMTAFVAMWIACYMQDSTIFDHIGLMIIMLLGSSFVVAGSCSLNNYIDRDIDPLMKRTENRPTVTGVFSPEFALLIGASFVAIGLFLLSFTSWVSMAYGIIGFIGYVFVYSAWTKRKTWWNTIIGSIPGAVPILIGWGAIDPSLSLVAWALFAWMVIWQMPHFYAIAIRRVEEYKKAGIPMLPVVHGIHKTKQQIIFWILLLIPLAYFLKDLGIVFVIIFTCANLGWLGLSFMNKKAKNETKWATNMFIYSINYLLVICIVMVAVSI
jgi:protoheme IX farnesyltransferase